MSQDLKRERGAGNIRVGSRHGIHLYHGDTPIGTMLTADWAARVVEAVANATYFRDLATSQATRLAELVAELDAANAKVVEADEALEQARRDAGSDGTMARIREWLDRREATVAERASEAISPAAGGFNDLGAIESRAAKLRRAQYDGKLLHELRQLLETPEPFAVRYWRWKTAHSYDYFRFDGCRTQECDLYSDNSIQLEWNDIDSTPAALAAEAAERGIEFIEITAAELPEGVTP